MLADINCNSNYSYTLSLIARQYMGIHQIESVTGNIPLAISTAEAGSGSGQ